MVQSQANSKNPIRMNRWLSRKPLQNHQRRVEVPWTLISPKELSLRLLTLESK
jgi:hypothetical protein